MKKEEILEKLEKLENRFDSLSDLYSRLNENLIWWNKLLDHFDLKAIWDDKLPLEIKIVKNNGI